MRPAVFLDRDGVICEFIEELNEVKLFKLRQNVGEAIRALNHAGFYVFVVTNQPMIAKGKMSFVRLEEIHSEMTKLLFSSNAIIDKIYFCPHRVGGVIPEVSIPCNCRKPGIGMLESAAHEFKIDKSHSYMVGDTWRDVECARKFGISAFGVKGGGGFPYATDSEEARHAPDKLFDGLPEAVASILDNLKK